MNNTMEQTNPEVLEPAFSPKPDRPSHRIPTLKDPTPSPSPAPETPTPSGKLNQPLQD